MTLLEAKQREMVAKFEVAKMQARQRTLTTEYKGCSLHVNAILAVVNSVPTITGFTLSDWHGPETVATFVDGENRS